MFVGSFRLWALYVGSVSFLLSSSLFLFLRFGLVVRACGLLVVRLSPRAPKWVGPLVGCSRLWAYCAVNLFLGWLSALGDLFNS